MSDDILKWELSDTFKSFYILNRVRRGRESKPIMLRTEGYFLSGNWEFSQWNHPTVRVSMASGGLPKNTISEVNLLTRVTELVALRASCYQLNSVLLDYFESWSHNSGLLRFKIGDSQLISSSKVTQWLFKCWLGFRSYFERSYLPIIQWGGMKRIPLRLAHMSWRGGPPHRVTPC